MRKHGPRLGPKPASCGSEKSHLLGASTWSSTLQGGPLYGWKKRGIFAVVGSGQRGLLVCLHVAQLLAHRAQVSQPHGARGPLMAGIRSPAGVKGRLGHSVGERGRLTLRQHPGKTTPRPPVPKSILRTLSLRSWESCWEVWPMGSRAVLWVAGWASLSQTGA